ALPVHPQRSHLLLTRTHVEVNHTGAAPRAAPPPIPQSRTRALYPHTAHECGCSFLACRNPDAGQKPHTLPQRQVLWVDFLPTPEGGGFPWLRRVHAASTLGGWRFTDRPTARSPRPVTASPAARMFFAAFTSALAWWPQARHRNSAWL